MGRRRTKHHDLPPGVHRKGGRLYYGRNDTPLGPEGPAALRKWAELAGERYDEAAPTFADAAREYRLRELANKAVATQKEYDRQLKMLVTVFGRMQLDKITPGDVYDFLELRPKIAGTRDKAVLSLVFNFARTKARMTSAPNPCAGVRGTKSHRTVYVDDEALGLMLAAADELQDRPLRDFLELAYRTGADASVVLRMTRQDVQNGAIRAARSKTGRVAEVENMGPLEPLLRRLLALSFPVQALNLILDENGQRMTLQTMRQRFWKARAIAGSTWQIRDLRAKASSDSDSLEDARKLLAHSDEATTAGYRRSRIGERARPVMREIADKTAELRKRRGGGKAS